MGYKFSDRLSDRTKGSMIKIVLLAMIVMVPFWMAGCKGTAMVDFKEALEKTSAIDKGQAHGEIGFSFTAAENATMDEETKNRLQLLEDIRWTVDETYDKTKDALVMEGTISLGGIGMDFGYQQNGDDKLVRLPVIDKYITPDELKAFAKTMEEKQMMGPSEETVAALRQLFAQSLEEENVFKGEKSILETPDGNVKARLFSITFTPEQTTDLIGKAIVIIKKDPKMKGVIPESFLMEKSGHGVAFKAWVDADGLIIKDELLVDVHLDNEYLQKFSMTFSTVRSRMGIDQDFQWVTPSEEDILDAESLEKNLPATLKPLLDATGGKQ